jgi:hypothetical protein
MPLLSIVKRMKGLTQVMAVLNMCHGCRDAHIPGIILKDISSNLVTFEKKNSVSGNIMASHCRHVQTLEPVEFAVKNVQI